jgi:hypothetical protein
MLISRKDWRRPGRRFVTRGLDPDGAAANFAENEHVIAHHLERNIRLAAYNQTRGSIPLIWSMKPDLKWSPKVNIVENFDYIRNAARAHFGETTKVYQK